MVSKFFILFRNGAKVAQNDEVKLNDDVKLNDQMSLQDEAGSNLGALEDKMRSKKGYQTD
jgi:hypothetical protein